MEISASSNPGQGAGEPNAGSSATSPQQSQDSAISVAINLNSISESAYTKNTATPTTNINPTAPKNIKNMSIKEFFTTRLMKGKSIDTSSGAHSPKDETTNWFDEFKAKMIKKSQKSSTLASSAKDNIGAVDENQSEESNDSGDNASRQTKRGSRSRLRTKLNKATSGSSGKPKHNTKLEQCDNNTNLGVLNESFEDLTEFSSTKDYHNSANISRDSNLSFKSPGYHFMSLRSRRQQRVSSIDKPDFDTASINTIVGRRDSRYGFPVATRTSHMIFNKLTLYFYAILKWIITNILPFNYTLPWKLISSIMFSLVILVIGFESSANPENGIFSFVNGFLCGISIATLCFIITFLSLIVRILPDGKGNKSMVGDKLTSNISVINNTSQASINQRATSSSDYSLNQSSNHLLSANINNTQGNLSDERSFCDLTNDFASDGLGEPDTTSRASDPTSLDDESYKGWMIEFVGDYEFRNRGDVKLKLLYVKFENRILYLYKVKSNQDIESSSFPSNVQSRVYDLKAVRKFSASLLFPKNVRNLKKWLWSKKYPIKIEFSQPAAAANNTNASFLNTNSPTNSNDNISPSLSASQTGQDCQSPSKKFPSQECKTIQLTLFTKTCREKEEWFRRFKRIVEEIRLAHVSECNSNHSKLSSSLILNPQVGSQARKSLTSDQTNVTNADSGSIKSHYLQSMTDLIGSKTSIIKRDLFRDKQATGNLQGVQTSTSSTTMLDSTSTSPASDSTPNNDNHDKMQQQHLHLQATQRQNLIRTKSCEFMHDDDANSLSSDRDSLAHEMPELSSSSSCTTSSSASASSNTNNNTNQVTNDYSNPTASSSGKDTMNDSTLTPANAEFYSQAVGDLNFIETRPNLDYREYIERVIGSSSQATNTSDWFNSLTGRIFFDVFSQNYWSYWFKRKIQRKLHRIRLPYFMDTLTLTNIDLGSNSPQFLNVVSHQFDSFGLSIDFDVSYKGGLTMTFETKLNLLKMKPDQQQQSQTQTESGATSLPSASNSNQTTPDPSADSQERINTPTASFDLGACGPGAESTGFSEQGTNQSNQADQESCFSTDKSSYEHGATETQATQSQVSTCSSCPPTTTTMAPTAAPPQATTGSNSLGSSNFKASEESVSTSSLGGTGVATTSDSSGSDSDSSSDSSSDEADIDEISDWEDYGAEKTRQNLVKLVDKIASSRYFQQATENRYIKKKLLDISNCPLILVVKIESLTGVLTFNIPPPQTDRVWYGFRPNPELVLKAMPRMGDREVSLSHVTDWIERKLEEEFRKILVIPNMEDVVLPVLKSDHLLYVTPTK